MAENQYESRYDGEVKETYKKLTERPAFRYEAAADPAYNAYRQRYAREGKLAMKNTVAEAADLTGGYGNSYAQRLGQQQYGAYLEKLNDALPQLYGEAYERYKAEGEALSQRLNAAAAMADADFDRHKDAADREDNKAALDYKKQQDAYQNLADAISNSGYLPTEEELLLSGMSPQLAAALSNEFLRRNNLLPGASSGAEVNYYNLSPNTDGQGYDSGIDREWLKLSAARAAKSKSTSYRGG